ncbi:putative Sec7 domain-containing protein [Rosellinia necatrix]|uniref:Putative Sec7 domain-containing protein n=1 Tax=Rosellinia necatrix TaxID=77044 RepID=A0A1S7UNT9_ROSNE|nr:putative Sec7 domain-containing protein [Rosellinia necatrix]
MHPPTEQSRRPQSQRPELNLDTSTTIPKGRDVAPESFPTRKPAFPAKGKPPVSSRGLKLPASSSAPASKRNSEDSFLENDSPTDAERAEFEYRHGRPPRDSHDLSLPAQKFTRDSLLGNMLNSLDQFSLTQISTPIAPTYEDDGDPYGVPRGDSFTRSMTTASRPPANIYASGNPHGHGYSYSSDLEGFDDAASRISSQVSRGRRSDSGSGFQSGLPRINSMRERSHPGTPGKRALHSRGGKTSKSSSINSFEIGGGGYAQGLPSQRWGHAVGGRSSSFDYGQRPSLSSPGHWEAEFPNTFLVDDYEAAPNPTIPGGPRRLPASSSPVVNPSAPPSEYEPKTPDRKRDTRSRSGTNKTTQSKYGAVREVAPPLPVLDVDSAPAPHVGYGKAKEVQPTGPASAPPVKEKQGFFSRLFGSSRSTPTSAVEPLAAPAPTAVTEPLQSGTNKANPVTSQAKPLSAPPTRDSEPPRQTPHVIQKKSSFFRRRKKSITEPPVPPLPVPHPIDISKSTDGSIPAPEPSPVSSLRQVMNPYLKGSNPALPQDSLTPRRDGTTHTFDAENNRRVRGFSPEYDPSPSATIRTVKSTSALKNQESRWRSQLESPMRSPPDVPVKSTNTPESTTFFHDSSDEGERGPVGARKQRKRAQTGKATSSGTAYKSKDTDDGQIPANLEVPITGVRKSSSRPTLSRSASSVPSVTVDSSQASPRIPGGPLDEPEVSVGEPTEDDRQKAQGIYDGDQDFIQKEKAAAWMGEEGPVRQRTLRAYMDLYDFENQSVLAALRQVCSRLVFRAETQQVDRILVAFSKRWCDCNPKHGFKTNDVIHTMCYSIMLLNTDLHLADIEQKMTRNQFIKNTMSTITQAVVDSAPEALNRTSIIRPKNTMLSPADSEALTPIDTEQDKPSWRASFNPLPRSESALGFHADSGACMEACGPLVKAPFDGSIRAWEGQVEIVLKDIYTSIRDERLPLFGAEATYQPPQPPSGLTVMARLKRTPSVLSKAPSEGQASLRGRINEVARAQGGRWTSKSRSRPRLGNGFSSSRTSFEDSNSIWSPSASSATWSRNSLGRTQTSMSIDSFASGYPASDYQQSIGFANALSQAIIRDDYAVGNGAQSIISEDFQSTQLLEDESLELLGPPWAKEGIVIHKHHLDGVDKKAKDRNWNEVFAVVQKGTMSLFSFSTKSMRQKARAGRKPVAGAVVGGGNWQENATSLGSFSLRQTLASELPPPGYSRTRPHVWALSLPSGAVHLFQVGTPEISKEFVVTINYWSARLSTHPLVGGISNIEYGWSDGVINNALIGAMEEPAIPQRPGSAAAARTSTHSRQGSRQSSLRSSFDMGGNTRTKLPGDRIHIAEWAPPSQSLRPSQCSESEQLETLVTYVKSVEGELQQHNQLRSPMLLAFTPRGHNAAKAMANWERKSSYLLREIVKFTTYVDSLQHASERRNEIYTERENARRAARGEEIDDSASAHSDDEADMTLRIE